MSRYKVYILFWALGVGVGLSIIAALAFLVGAIFGMTYAS